MIDAQTLFKLTVARLRKHEGSYAEIARQSGLSYSSLTKLAQGHAPNPTVENLQAVIEALDAFEGVAKEAGSAEGTPGRRIDTPEAVSRLLGVPRAAAEPPPAEAPAADSEPEVPGDSRVVPFEAPP